MINPYLYKLSNKVDYDNLIKAGFEHTLSNTYRLKKVLYLQIIVEVEIDLREKWMTYFVKNKFADYYTPFYLEEQRTNNKVYPKVVQEFNRFMDSLCAKEILWRKDYKPKFYVPITKRFGFKRRKRQNVS